MEKTIKLKNSYGRLADREPFVISTANEERFFLNIDSDIAIHKLIVVYRRGNYSAEQRYFPPVGEVKQIEIPAEFVKVGTLEIELHVVSYGTTIAKYHVEPIVFAQIETGFEGHPEIEEYKSALQAQRAEIEQLSALIGTLNARLYDAEEQLDRLYEAIEQ